MSNPKNEEFLKKLNTPQPPKQPKTYHDNAGYDGPEYDNPRRLCPKEPDPTATDWA